MSSPPEESHEPKQSLGYPGSGIARLIRGLVPEDRRYWILIPLTGLSSGLLAVGLIKFLDLVQELAWGTSDDLLSAATKLGRESPLLVFAILASGGLFAAIVLFFVKDRHELQGTTAIIEALAFRKGRIPALKTIIEAVISMVCVGTGASLGREGALIRSGAAVSSVLGVRFRLDEYHVKVLVACGAAGGMAAAYNVPVGATVFALEVLLGSFALELIGPVLISSFISTTIARLLLQSNSPAYVIPRYELVIEWEILLDVVLGAGMGVVSVAFIRIFSGVHRLFRWLDSLQRVKPVVAMLILAAVGIVFPQLFGNGYHTVNQVLLGKETFGFGILILLPVLKILVTALCRSGGLPGGLFTPSLFIGALIGAAFGTGVDAIFPPGAVAKPGAYALVGMGAILAGTIQAPITAILMIFEMTRDYEIIVPLMSACAASALVSSLLQEGSIFTEPMRRRGIRLPRAFTPTWMRQPKVWTVLEPDVAAISPVERFQNVVDHLLMAPEGHDQVYVTSQEGTYLGSISLHEIKRYFRETQHLDSVIAADIVNPSAPFVYADDPLSRAIELLSTTSAEYLPVLTDPVARRLVGTVSKRSLLAAYSAASLPHQNGTDPPLP
ncbi:MAG TPA: chloride channel protein [Planctomycetota bacterium]|jgi:CIC family chloride channel protein|nr:chloride channel protein [Planctomycetota bacterium]